MLISSILDDLRFAARMLARNSGATAAALVALALGIGANSAIFSLVHAVVMRPLPYPDAARLAAVWVQAPAVGASRLPLTDAELLHFQRSGGLFAGLAGYVEGEVNLTGADQPERVAAAWVSASLFPVLGARPDVGRVFEAEEDAPGHDQVVMLSHDFWQRRFAADRAIVGHALRLDGTPYTVVGVLRPGFHFPSPATALWLPLGLDPAKTNPANHRFSAVGRLPRGMSPRRCEAASKGIALELSRTYPDAYPAAQLASMGFGLQVIPLQEEVVGDVRPALLILLGAVGLVLLIACANVANLLLAQAEGRRREVAVRAALGCGRRRLVRQLLTESALLAAAGAAGGLAVAFFGVKLLLALDPQRIPRLDEVGLDLPTFAFNLWVGLLTSLLFGLVPALRSAGEDLSAALREGTRGAGLGLARHRLARLLVVAEVALAAGLLAGAGLLIRSLDQLRRVDPGFHAGGVITCRLALPPTGYADRKAVNQLHQRLLGGLKGAAGIEAAALINVMPLDGRAAETSFEIEGRPGAAGDRVPSQAQFRVATPGAFAALGIALRRGRAFTEGDDDRAEGVAVVDQTMAATFWPGQDPIGKRLRVPGATDRWRTVVGVASAVRYGDLRTPPVPVLYLPEMQMAYSPALGGWRSMTLLVRAAGSDPARLASLLRARVAALDRDLPLSAVETLSGVESRSLAQPRFTTFVLAIFAGLALLLAVVGIYGVLSYLTARRTHEIGIRMAIGASRASILNSIVASGMSMAGLGLLLGVAGALLLTRLLASLLFGVGATDPATFSAVVLLLLGVSWLAVLLPAWKATHTDPTEALRAE